MRNFFGDIAQRLHSASKGAGTMKLWDKTVDAAAAPSETLRALMDAADAIVVGAGAGLSTAAGFTYSGARFERYFHDFGERFGIQDIYSGGFYPYPDRATFWGWWCRHIWVNRYAPLPSGLYARLLQLLEGRDFFVLTTNVDHALQRAGFPKKRLFYTQGDYGLFQSSEPHGLTATRTYDNRAEVEAMLRSEGWQFAADGDLIVPAAWEKAACAASGAADETADAADRVPATDETPSMRIAEDLIPYCAEMTTNLRADDTFVEDAGWHAAADRYEAFLARTQGADRRVLYLELGVGANTPGIIKYPFWRMTAANPNACYVAINPAQQLVPDAIAARALSFACGIDAVV